VSIVFAVTKAYDDVVARFAADGTSCEFFFGWREPPKQNPYARRIVVVPGDPSGAVGSVGAARFPGRNPRPLATLGELFTVVVEGYDATDARNERAQYQIVRELWDAYYRALYLSAHGTFEVLSMKWDVSKNTVQRGAMLVATIAIQAMIPDAPLEVAPTDTRAVVVPSLDAVNDGSGTSDASAVTPWHADAATTGPITLSGEQTIDGVALEVGAVALVKNQGDASANGLYVVAELAWSRASHALALNTIVTVDAGTIGAGRSYQITTYDPGTAIAFSLVTL